MDFSILGALEVRDRWGQLVPLGGHKQRTLLAILLLERNQPVSMDRLIRLLWSDVPPSSARHSVHLMVHRLRRVLSQHGETDRLATSDNGYVFSVGDGELDADRFAALLATARAARADGRLAEAVGACDAALALVKGPPLAGLPTDTFAPRDVMWLERLHIDAASERATSMLAQGRHAEVTATLEELTRLHPTRERLARLLLLALYRSGRQADALAAYHKARQALLEQHGREPGAELQELQRAILVQDPGLAAPVTARPDAVLAGAPAHPPASPQVSASAQVPTPSHARTAANMDMDMDADRVEGGNGQTDLVDLRADADADADAGTGREDGGSGAAAGRDVAERRVVTVLVARLVWDRPAATAPDDGDDVEARWARQSRAVGRVRAEVERLGGTVHSGLGETVLATFGARRAHRDDPVRAVRAALAIVGALAGQEQAGPAAVRVSVGIDTGAAVVAPEHAGRPPNVTGAVTDSAIGLATAAPAGAVLVGAVTYRATTPTVSYRAAAETGLVHSARSAGAWLVVGAGEDEHPRGAAPAVVGREEELSLLTGIVDRVRAERRPRLVTIVGAPGVGKSRLVQELGERLARQPAPPAWHQGRSLPYGDGVTYWALREIVMDRAGISVGDRVEEAERKLRGMVDAATGGAVDVEWASEYLERLVRPEGAVDDDTGWQRQAFEAWRRILEAAAAGPTIRGDRDARGDADELVVRPLILVFEDAHWADDAMLDFVEHLADHAAEVPLLVICVAWPELRDRRPAWDGGRRNAITLALAPLSRPHTEELLGDLVDAETLPDDRRAQLLTGAGGNPLFIHEYVRTLRGRVERDQTHGLEPGGLVPPETLQLLIGARLDDLDPADRALLADAAVLGETMWAGALASLSGRAVPEVTEALRRLARREFLRRVPEASVPGEAEYRFGHVLIRDVAYGRLLRGHRADRHRRAASWLEQLGADGAADRAEVVAHHYLQAVSYLRADGRSDPGLAGQAARALREAGDRAAALAAGRAALRYYAQALELWPADLAGHAELLLDHEGLRMELEEQADQARLTAAYEGLLTAGDQVRAARALSLLSSAAWLRREPAAAAEYERRARELLSRADASPDKTLVLTALANNLLRLNRYAEGRVVGAEAVTLARRFGLRKAEAWALSAVGAGRVVAGDVAGLADLRQGATMLDEMGSAVAANAYVNLATAAAHAGDIDAMVAGRNAISDSIARSEASGFQFWLGVVDIAWHYLRGAWDDAAAVGDTWIAQLAASGAHYMDGVFRHVRARVWLGRGRVDEAMADFEAAFRLTRHADEHSALGPAAGYGSALLTTGRDTDGTAAGIAAELPGRLAGHMITPFAGADLPYLLAAFGQVPEMDTATLRGSPWLRAIHAYGTGRPEVAADVYAQMGAPAEAALARLHAGERFAAGGRAQDAADQLTRARTFYETVGASFYLARIEELLAST